MKVNKGIIKGESPINKLSKQYLKRITYSKNLEQDFEEPTIKKLLTLQVCISNVQLPNKNWEEADNEAWNLNQYLQNRAISKITIYGSDNFHIESPLLIRQILMLINGKIKIAKKGSHRNVESLGLLLRSGGYEIIMELKEIGFSDSYLIDFIEDRVQVPVSEYGTRYESKIRITSIDSFKSALYNYKKKLK